MFQISLRQLFILVATIALAIVSLKYASEILLSLGAMAGAIVFVAAAIVAVVGRGPRQAFAIGFVAATVGYGLLIVSGGTRNSSLGLRYIELDIMYNVKLPTTRLLSFAHKQLKQELVLDAQGNSITAQQRDLNNAADWKAGRLPSSQNAERPPSESFTRIGQLWFALLFGYLGGLFARFVYLRRQADQCAGQGE